MAGVDPKIVDAILEHQLDLLRVEAGTRTKILRLLNTMQRDLQGQLTAGGQLAAYTKERLRALLKQSGETVEAYYGRLSTGMEETLRQIAQSSAAHSLSITAAATLPTQTFFERLVSNTLIHGAPSSDWWSRQSKNSAFKFANVVRQGMASGHTNEQIVARVAETVMPVARADARALVHTSVQTVANAARFETFRQNADVVEGVRQLSTLDSHTTEICIAYADQEWDLKGNPVNGTTLPYNAGPPRHWNCRSVLVPITTDYEGLGLPKGLDAIDPSRKRKQSLEDWLLKRTTEQQDEQLGKGKAQLWRDGKITLEQLLDQTGNPLTFEELRRRHG